MRRENRKLFKDKPSAYHKQNVKNNSSNKFDNKNNQNHKNFFNKNKNSNNETYAKNKSNYGEKEFSNKNKFSSSKRKFENNKNFNELEKPKKEIFLSTFIVNHSIELLEFLLSKCKTSRNNVKSLLTNKKVLVNGCVVSQYNFMLAKDDEIKISKYAISSNEQKLPKKQNNKKITLPFSIIYEDEDFIAIDKPNGLLSVEADKEHTCAYSYMFNYFQQIDKNKRPYILHRIDKETSGVLVFCKNIKLHSMLRLNWNDLVKTREYIAIVEGNFNDNNGTISSYLKENKNNMVYSTFDSTGQKAITNYEVINNKNNLTMLKVNIDTGRKNQIRVHLQTINHPIIGDNKYGCNIDPLKRLGLHATKLEFTHPLTKNLISITSNMPTCFKTLF